MFQRFRLTDEEYEKLYDKFGDLCKFAAWQLKRKNAQNNLIDTDIDDIIQDLLIAVIRAGVYFKRQNYIEDCLQVAEAHVFDPFIKQILDELIVLWKNRTKHGANKQKFGDYQEKILDCIVNTCVPECKRPDPKSRLQIDKKFTTYCKQITWNQQKSLGRKITKERSIRNGAVSLGLHPHMDGHWDE